MKFSFSAFLNTYKPLIISRWVEKLHTECGEQYAARPVEELFGTISRAVDTNYQVLAHENYHAPVQRSFSGHAPEKNYSAEQRTGTNGQKTNGSIPGI